MHLCSMQFLYFYLLMCTSCLITSTQLWIVCMLRSFGIALRNSLQHMGLSLLCRSWRTMMRSGTQNAPINLSWQLELTRQPPTPILLLQSICICQYLCCNQWNPCLNISILVSQSLQLSIGMHLYRYWLMGRPRLWYGNGIGWWGDHAYGMVLVLADGETTPTVWYWYWLMGRPRLRYGKYKCIPHHQCLSN